MILLGFRILGPKNLEQNEDIVTLDPQVSNETMLGEYFFDANYMYLQLRDDTMGNLTYESLAPGHMLLRCDMEVSIVWGYPFIAGWFL